MIRLQRFLAQAGVASRRKAEQLITAGRVKVDGKVVTVLGTKVDPDLVRVEVDGRAVRPETLRYLVLNKPPGVVTTLDDPEGRPTIGDLLPEEGPRLFPVGRLDFFSEGTLLITNDGELAQNLTHPSRQVEKVYRVRVRGKVADEVLGRLSKGVELEDGPTGPLRVLVSAETKSHTWLEITVREGRNRLIRRMCDALDLPVMRLIRSRFAGLSVEDLQPGTWRVLTRKEIDRLKSRGERKPPRGSRSKKKGKGGRGKG